MLADSQRVNNMYSRKFPKIYNGFTVIKEDGTVEKPQKRHNGFKVEEDEEEATKVVEELPAKKDVPLKNDIL